MRLWKINDREDSVGQPRGWGWREVRWYLYARGGTVLKGWWHVLPVGRSLRWWWGVTVKLGGEDGMLQVGVKVPLLFRGAVGVRVPRAWQDGWVYQGREWGIESGWRGFDLLFAFDDDMSDMRDYYRRKLGERKVIRGRLWPSDAMLWNGWRLRVRFPRLLDLLLGKRVRERQDADGGWPRSMAARDVVVPLPEGEYAGRVSFFRERAVRPRWPFGREWSYLGELVTDEWMPFPGKGENSYDCGDDGFKELSVVVRGGEPVSQVVGEAVRQVLRQRERYGGASWRPKGVGVMDG